MYRAVSLRGTFVPNRNTLLQGLLQRQVPDKVPEGSGADTW